MSHVIVLEDNELVNECNFYRMSEQSSALKRRKTINLIDKTLRSDIAYIKKFSRTLADKSRDIEDIVYNTLVDYKYTQENARIVLNDIKSIKNENRAIRKLFDKDDESLD